MLNTETSKGYNYFVLIWSSWHYLPMNNEFIFVVMFSLMFTESIIMLYWKNITFTDWVITPTYSLYRPDQLIEVPMNKKSVIHSQFSSQLY